MQRGNSRNPGPSDLSAAGRWASALGCPLVVQRLHYSHSPAAEQWLPKLAGKTRPPLFEMIEFFLNLKNNIYFYLGALTWFVCKHQITLHKTKGRATLRAQENPTPWRGCWSCLPWVQCLGDKAFDTPLGCFVAF